MKIKIENKILADRSVLFVPVFEENSHEIAKKYPPEIKDFLKKRIENDEFKAEKGELIDTYTNSGNLPDKMALLGLGKGRKFNNKIARECGALIGKYGRAKKNKKISILVTPELAPFIEEFAEGLFLSLYQFEHHKSEKLKKERPYKLEELIFIGENQTAEMEQKIKKAKILSEAVEYIKDLVNGPPNIIDSEHFEISARRIAKENGYKITVLTDEKLKKNGWGALLAVNRGSHKEAKAIILEHNGTGKPVALVGKGVIFDSGGYNLKPFGHIETMHQDMAGAAVVLGIFSVLKKLGIKKHIIGIIPVAENLINEKAFRPSEIIKTLSGLTVEITNTDAEGRLILADAITKATEYKPEAIITIATLTGAVATALGDRYAGILGNDPTLRKRLQRAGQEVDDLVWPLPLHPDFIKKMKSRIADVRNRDIESYMFAGSSKGAAFLSYFVGKNRWSHIDLGGTAYTVDPKEYETRGATAHSFRLMVRFLES